MYIDDNLSNDIENAISIAMGYLLSDARKWIERCVKKGEITAEKLYMDDLRKLERVFGRIIENEEYSEPEIQRIEKIIEEIKCPNKEEKQTIKTEIGNLIFNLN